MRTSQVILLQSLKENRKVILSNESASLIDLGDEVACLEFHTRGNALGPEINEMIRQSMEEVGENYRGLVIANEGKNFCVGANIDHFLTAAEAGDFDTIEANIREVQSLLLQLKYFEKPVVAAPHQKTLGGGAEVCLAADQIIFSAETNFGLVETGVGLIPAGGGCKELVVRASKQYADPAIDLQPAINKAFETLMAAKVSKSGSDAHKLGFMRPNDIVIADSEFRIAEAKQAVLRLDEAGYKPPVQEPVRVVGDGGKAVLSVMAYGMKIGGFISEYDQYMASKVAHVLSGGDVQPGSLVTEQYLLDLERKAFVSLIREEKTLERIRSILTTGKPLRN